MEIHVFLANMPNKMVLEFFFSTSLRAITTTLHCIDLCVNLLMNEMATVPQTF